MTLLIFIGLVCLTAIQISYVKATKEVADHLVVRMDKITGYLILAVSWVAFVVYLVQT